MVLRRAPVLLCAGKRLSRILLRGFRTVRRPLSFSIFSGGQYGVLVIFPPTYPCLTEMRPVTRHYYFVRYRVSTTAGLSHNCYVLRLDVLKGQMPIVLRNSRNEVLDINRFDDNKLGKKEMAYPLTIPNPGLLDPGHEDSPRK